MKELTTILREATASIASGYFRVDIAGGLPVYRERVYCYELYHQMRSRWPAQCDLTLNGELDKVAHPLITNYGISGSKPDFLIHRPGKMNPDDNHAIIEVKRANASVQDIQTDLRKLDEFIRAAQYQRAIYLFFGCEADCNLISKIQKNARGLNGVSSIELWMHTQSGKSATHTTTLSLSDLL